MVREDGDVMASEAKSAEPAVLAKRRQLATHINVSNDTRLWNILSYLFILLVGIPYWWHTTSIERRPLPSNQVEGAPNMPVFAHSIPIALSFASKEGETISGSSKLVDDVVAAYERQCSEQAGENCKLFHWTQSPDASPEALQVVLHQADGQQPLIQRAGVRNGHLLISLPDIEVTSPELPAFLAAEVQSALSVLVPSQPPKRSIKAIKYSQSVTLSFSLLNEDASLGGGIDDWEIERAIEGYLRPFLEPLSDIYQFKIESQVVAHAPLKALPRRDEAKNWIISREHMKSFVNSEQWTLDSGSSNDPVLRFMLFVPSQSHSPMYLGSAEGSSAFHIPQSGGVVIYQDVLDTEIDLSQGIPASRRLAVSDLRLPFTYFASQLYALLGVPTLPVRFLPLATTTESVTRPLDGWQKVNLMRSLAESNMVEAQNSLTSIARLVGKIKEMVINEDVQSDVAGAVNALQQITVRTGASLRLSELFSLAREASRLANKAFFNPSMMGLLYFPDEHKYAVYTPLFAPVAVPIVVALLKELKGLRGRRKLQRLAVS